MQPHAIFLDIDGTLVPDGHHGTVPSGNVRALLAAQAQGHFVFLNTGRCRAAIRPSVWADVPFDGVLSSIGANLLVRGQTIRNELLPEEGLRETFRFCADHGIPALFGNAEHAYVIHRGRFWPTPMVTEIDPDRLPPDFRLDNIQKIDLPAPHLLAGARDLLSRFADYYDHGFYVEAFPVGCTKSDGLLRVAAHLNIPPERCIAMGDSINDTDMLLAAGHRVAMGNACDELKAVATLVTDTSENCGVAEALHTLLGV